MTGMKVVIGWLAFIGLFVALGALAWTTPEASAWLQAMVEKLRSTGPYAVLAYIGIYIILATLSAPTTPLNIIGGVLFTYWIAVLGALAAGATAATLMFLIARHFAAEKIREQMQKSQIAASLNQTVSSQGFKVVLLARLNPLIPAAVKNFGFGVTDVPLAKYAGATVLGQLPIVMIHTYLGFSGGAAIVHRSSGDSPLHMTALILGVIVSFVLLIVLWLYGRRSLQRS